MTSYDEFLKAKAHPDKLLGFKPLSMPSKLFDFQSHLTEWSIRKGRCALFEDCGLGKGQPYGSKILTMLGWKKIEDMNVGDAVFGSNGKPALVTGVHHKSILPCYRIGFSDGSSFVCDEDHLHILRTNNDRQRKRSWRVMTTKKLLKQKLRYGKSQGSRNFDIPIVKPIEFEEKWQRIPAYTMGVLLGDGGLTGASIQFTSNDPEIVDRVRVEMNQVGLRVVKVKYSEYGWRISGRESHHGNPVLEWMRRIELMGKYSYEKSIPKNYLFGSVQQRIDLLKGLMDTDGYISKGGCCQFGSSSKNLAKQVAFLVRSLGGVPTSSKKKTSYKKDGVKIECRDCHLVTFSLKGINPFFLKRKAERWNPNPRDNGRWIDFIRPVGNLRTVCLTVDSKDHSYVTRHCIVTHNSVQELAWADNIVRKTNKNVLLLTPIAVGPQMVREGQKFGIECKHTRTGQVFKGITVTNYEQLDKFDPNDFIGLVADESSCLKHFEAKTRHRVTEFMKKVRYGLLATATPSPNDYMELGTSSEALGAMGRNQMLGMFFSHDSDDTQQWTLKGHARKRFWQWVCTWARALRKPSDLGFDDDGFILPPLEVEQHLVKGSVNYANGFYIKEVKSLNDQRHERRVTIQARSEKVAELVSYNKGVSVCWCHLNPEGDLLEEIIPGAVQVAGCNTDEEKEERFNAFTSGQIKVLITKPKLGGFGLNWQHCNHMTFYPSHSFESYYQAVRRCWRFGQKNKVKIDVVSGEAEARVFRNMRRKENQMSEMFAQLVAEMSEYQMNRKVVEAYKKVSLPSWLMNGR